ncbi:uncharacterized protein G2W53_028535 [Senna tora]|uniref:Transmembrane protein n=1 Tax=Senna tora TaxID=362788 RepID=A0A834WCX4_9FABA|nr:uncharacterized protein G2W53_028535 [Senna tora]
MFSFLLSVWVVLVGFCKQRLLHVSVFYGVLFSYVRFGGSGRFYKQRLLHVSVFYGVLFCPFLLFWSVFANRDCFCTLLFSFRCEGGHTEVRSAPFSGYVGAVNPFSGVVVVLFAIFSALHHNRKGVVRRENASYADIGRRDNNSSDGLKRNDIREILAPQNDFKKTLKIHLDPNGKRRVEWVLERRVPQHRRPLRFAFSKDPPGSHQS